MTINEIIKAGEDLCNMIFDLALQPRISLGERYRLNSLGCDISSCINIIASIVADSTYLTEEENS